MDTMRIPSPCPLPEGEGSRCGVKSTFSSSFSPRRAWEKVGMRVAPALVVLFLHTASLLAQAPQTPAQYDKERQKVAAQKLDSVIITEYALKGGKPEKKGRLDMLQCYDKNGNKIFEGRYDKDQIDTKQTFQYDANNHLSELQSYMQFNTLSYTRRFTYDDKGRVQEAKNESNMSKNAERQTFHYREGLFTANDGVLTEVKFYIAPNKVGYRDVFTYEDKSGKPVPACTKMIRYRIDNSIEKRENYKYDANGNLVEIATWGNMEFDEATAKLVSKKTFTYDTNGAMTSESETNAKNQLLAKSVHTYDASGKLAETTVWYAKKPPAKPNTLRKYAYTMQP
jgi:hypothetical protein